MLKSLNLKSLILILKFLLEEKKLSLNDFIAKRRHHHFLKIILKYVA